MSNAMILDELVEILAPTRSTEFETPAEVDLGPGIGVVSLPPDYVQFVRRFGVGRVNGFLHILVPNCPNKFLDLAYQFDTNRQIFINSKEEGLFPNSCYAFPEPGG